MTATGSGAGAGAVAGGAGAAGWVASDTGGTFTDLVAADGSVAKVPSTPDDPGRAVRDGLAALAASGGSPGGRPAVLAHGTTVATNALLERRGAVVGLVTTAGFADVIEIARQDRPSLYDQSADRPTPLVARDHRHEVGERSGPGGEELRPVDLGSLPALAPEVEAVAVCLLHADLAPGHEREVGAELARRGHDVTLSSEVSPEVREYERTSTAVVNAYLRPVCRAYLRGLAGVADRVLAMTSAGGLVPAAAAAEQPARLLLSGPAGGVLAGAAAAVANGFPDAVTFDMGGTSTDVCLVVGGRPAPAGEREVDGLPVRLPSLDVHTIGAGGGSIARVDAGGALAVGPASAGAVPGPACYGRGGVEPTVTDADLVAGRLPAGVALPGLGVLDRAAAAAALDGAGVTAEGVLAVVDAHMTQAIRAVTVEQGSDPRGLALVAFGGAGPLHACALADALGMPAVVVPARAGVLSAVGVLGAPEQVDVVRSWGAPLDHDGVGAALAALADEARARLAATGAPAPAPASAPALHLHPEPASPGQPMADGGTPVGGSRAVPASPAEPASPGQPMADGGTPVGGGGEVGVGVEVEVALDCRYAGQSHELRVPSVEAFHAEHERRNGYRRDGHPVEVVALRATARSASPVAVGDLPVPDHRAGFPEGGVVGPAALAEADCTIWVPDGWVARPGAAGALVLTRADGAAADATAGAARSGAAATGRTGVRGSADGRRGDAGPAGGGAGGGLDSAGLQILVGRLTAVADEMGAVLRRAAFSPNIKERADCSAALFTADGELLVQAEHIPVHLGSMPASVRAAIDACTLPDGSLALSAGDQVVVNDPFRGGTHLNDVTVVAPCFVGGRLVGWAANRAHHADVGGAAPGSLPADAVEVFEEGLRLPPVRLTDEVRAVLLANSRTPDERAGDLDAQVGANVLGVARLAELAGEPLDEVLAYGERRMRAELAALPDGTWRFEDVIDSFGPTGDQQVPGKVVVTVAIEGDEVTFDLTGTDPQRRGNVSAVEAVTVSAATFALRSAVDPTIPANGGALRPLRVVAPVGTIVNARPPAAVGAGNVEVSQRVADACLGALAQAVPGRLGAASQGTMNNLLMGGDGWVYYETVGGGQGGRPSGPGMSGIHTAMTNTRNTPVEALERAFPLLVLRYRLRQGSGGEGLAPGGEGIERDLLVLEDVTVSLITERRRSQPWGLGGGEPGAVGENWLLPQGDEARAARLPDKCTIRLEAGDVFRMLTPGGGGWGKRLLTISNKSNKI